MRCGGSTFVVGELLPLWRKALTCPLRAGKRRRYALAPHSTEPKGQRPAGATCLLQTARGIRIIDLHGSPKKEERCPDGSKDENVFDIQQGVAICLMVKAPRTRGQEE